MNIITRMDIDKKFSETVTELISKGWHINTGTMNSSQGEVAKVDLTDGTYIYRVLLETDYKYAEQVEHDIYVDILTIRIIKYPENVEFDSVLWNHGHGKDIFVKRFFAVNKSQGKYTENIDFLLNALKIRKDRQDWRINSNIDTTAYRYITMNPNTLTNIYRIVKGTKGYSGVKKSDIISVHRYGVEYIVSMTETATKTRWVKRMPDGLTYA